MQTKKFTDTIIKQLVFLMVLMLATLLLFPVKSVFAHATLIKSDPPRRAALTESPKHVQLWFNEEIESNYALITVLDSDGNSVSDEKPASVPDDLKSVVLAIPEISPGSYTVEYRVLSIDGHVVESNYSFRIKDQMQ
ncbi:MAG: copper resistance protein CopC [Betaproteobacteria bacterium]|nr:copper resistance protein CopC [Betaproteobacteria bacterium]